MSFDWTDERVSELRRLHGEGGMSAARIAVEMGVGSRNAVIGKLHRMGLGRADQLARPPPPPKPKRIARFQSHHTVCQQPVEPVMEQPPTVLEITFMQLEPHHCRYPSGEGRDILFCGRTVLDGFAYCPAHCRLCYQTPQARRRPDYNPPRVHG